MQDIDFDLAGARKAGAKPAQLSSYFKSNFNLDFDFDGAYKAGATDNQILSYLNQSYSDLKKKGNSGVDSGVKSSPTPSKYTLKEEAPKKQYYSSKLEKGLIFDKEGQLYAPSSEALTKAIAPPAEDLNLKKSTQKDLVEQSRIPEEKPKKQISIEPSFTSPLFGSPLEVKFLEEGEDPSILAGFTSSTLKGQIQGKVANILSAGKRPTPEELGEIAQLQSDLQLFPQSKSERVYQEKGLKGLFVDSPTLGVEFVAETMLSSLSALFEASKRTVPTAVAAGAVAGAPFAGVGAIPGATYGFLSGQLAAGYNLSTSQDILNSLSDNGVDISNKESLIKAFSDEKKMAKIRNTAAKYGIPILLFDAATAGLAGKFAAGAIGKSLSRKLLAGLGETGIQIGGGMGGEFTGQLASGKKVNWDDVVMEGLAEVPGGAVEVVTGLQLERSKTASNNKTLATQIATQGIQNGTEDAIVNLNRDLANNVITPEQHQEGVVFVEKAAQVVDKIPETVTGENKAKSIELLVERNDIKESNEILLQQKQASDEAYHAGINEEIKANDEKIKKINDEVFKIAKEPIVEEVEQPIVEEPLEVVEEQAVVEKPKLADKLSTFKEKYTLISEGAAKAIETKKINQQAGKIVPMDKEAAVLAWLSGNNELSWKAINEAAGRKEQARLNVGKDYSTEEVKIRDYAAKKRDGGETLRNAAHKIWQNLTKNTGDKNITTRDVETALLNAIRENPTRIDAAKNLISIAGAEEAPISIEEGVEDFYKRKGEQPTEPVVEQGMPEGGFVPFQEGEEEIPFSVQELPTDEVNDMKEIVKDLVEEGLNLNAIRNRISKELGYDSKRLRETVNKAYQEYTKEYTPEKVTTGVIARIGQFISDLFGGKAEDKVLILKDAQSTFAKAEQMAETGGRVEFQATLPNGEKVTAKPIDASIVNGFYSPLELQINQMKADKMPAKQWLDKLKGEEAKWTGLADWLSQQEGSLTKENIKNWLQDNQIQINEIVKGAFDFNDKSSWKYRASGDGVWTYSFNSGSFIIDASEADGSARIYIVDSGGANEVGLINYSDREQILDLALERNTFENYIDDNFDLNSTKYSKYVVNGEKSDYKEILITYPTTPSVSFEKWNENKKSYGESEGTLEEYKKAGQLFKSSHFDEKNILVHIRADIRTDAKGNKIYFIEEVQSDWGQEGKRKGFFEDVTLKEIERHQSLKNVIGILDEEYNKINRAAGYADRIDLLSASEFLSLPFNERRNKIEKTHKDFQNRKDEYINFLQKEINRKNEIIRNNIDRQNILEKEEYQLERFLDNVKSNREFNQANERLSELDKEIKKLNREAVALEEENIGDSKMITKMNNEKRNDDIGYNKSLESVESTFDINEYNKIEKEFLELDNKILLIRTHKAPFVTKTNDWVKLGLKVALKQAVKQGADKIAWTNGEQQNERYDLSKQVNYIERIPENDINKEQGDFYLDINLPNGMIGLNVNKDSGIITRSTGSVYRGDLIGKPLSDVIGKDIADKIMGSGAKKYEGEGLRIGGKGMIGFYGSPKDNSLGILGDLAKSLYKQAPEKISLNIKEAKLKELQKELDEHTANKTSDFKTRDFYLKEASDAAFYSLKEERLYNLEQADFYEKRAMQSAAYEDSTLREIKRLGVEYQYSVNITPELKAQVEVGLPLFQYGRKRFDSLINNIKINGQDISELLNYVTDSNDLLRRLDYLSKGIKRNIELSKGIKDEKISNPSKELRNGLLKYMNNEIEYWNGELKNAKEKGVLNKDGDISDIKSRKIASYEQRLEKLKFYKDFIDNNLFKTDDLKINNKPLSFMFEDTVLGFTFNNKIYLNGESLNPNTPIHEAGHIWTEWVKQFDNKVYQRGIELVKNSDYLKEVKSSKFYQEQAKKLATKEEAELYFQHEALAMAIGDKGAQFVTESKRTSFKEWLDTLWTKIRDLAGFKDITAEELQNLTFEEFTKMAVKDILGKQFEGRTLQEIYETLPMGKKLRQNKEEILIRDNFDNIVAELIKNNKIEKIC